jgi:hypothetical protein
MFHVILEGYDVTMVNEVWNAVFGCRGHPPVG